MRVFLWLCQFVLAVGLLVAFGAKWGSLPRLAPFLSPFEGFWRNAESDKAKPKAALSLSGLDHAVNVIRDQRHVPHLFASSEKDLYVAQGFVTASDRLWEMDVVTREAGGRLAEVMGPSLLEHDKMRRRYGLLAAAKAMEGGFLAHEGTRRAVQAYTDGVNAYLAQLRPRDWPLEFKLLDYAPEPWTPLKTALLIASIQWTLSASEHDQPLTATFGKYGALFFRKFFPSHDLEEPPIIPPGTPWGFATETPRPDSTRGDSLAPGFLPGGIDSTQNPADSGLPEKARMPANYHGSNNFVLSGARTRSGKPLLANDPHLDLGLPSTWYEMQLRSPGLNVYGVSLPGIPGIVIGFNDSLAWGLTNGADDVFDWYRVQFRDSTLREYFYDGRWVDTRRRIDTFTVRGGLQVFDTVTLTHHGPIVWREPEASKGRNAPLLHALRWLAHDTSDEVGAILRLQGCGTVPCFQAAITGFACPSQNFAVASITGDIGLFHMGRFPWKWPGQGRLILDGSDARHDWQGWVPWERIPKAINPGQGFLFSANQEPVDSTYPYHLGNSYTNPDRAVRLGERLAHMKEADIDSAFAIMRDDKGHHAMRILPLMISLLDSLSLKSPEDTLIDLLRHWDYRYRSEGLAPTVFEAWWQILYRAVWSDDFGEDKEHYNWPNLKVTRRLMLEDSASPWFDDVRTPQTESLRDLTKASFRSAIAQLRSEMGPSVRQWAWSRRRPVAIRHLLRLPSLGWDSLTVGGCADCIQAQRSGHGPSWRMAVSLTDPPEAFGIFPGGESGNPGSRHYDDFVSDWAQGKHYALTRYLSLPDADDASVSHQALEPR